jgi:hypothetical protein
LLNLPTGIAVIMVLSEAAESWTLKVECNGEIRRLRGWPESGMEPTLQTLLADVGNLFHVSCAECGSLSLFVHSGDGNMQPLTEDLLSELLASEGSESGRLLRLALVVARPELADVHTQHVGNITGTEGNAMLTETNAAPLGSEEAAGNVEFRPLLTNRLKHFGHQVANDCCCASDDAVQAFRPTCQGSANQGAGGAAEKAALVPAAVLGVCVAARRAPLRFAKTAAHTYAVAKGRSTLEEADLADEQQHEPTEDGEHPSPQGSQNAHVRDRLQQNLVHFRKQVTQDFQTAKEDVKATYTFVVGQEERSSTDQVAQRVQEQDGEQTSVHQQQRRRQLQQQLISPQSLAATRDKLPCVAFTTVGVAVAASLIPIRAVRLAVASTSAMIASTGVSTIGTNAR